MPWSNHLWNQNWHVLSITVWLVWLRHSSRCIFWLACRELWLCKSHQVVDSVFTYLAEPLQEHLRLGEAKNPNAFHYLSTIFPPGQNGLLSHSRSDNQDWKWKRHALSWAYLRELHRIRLWAPSSNQSTRTLTASQRRTHTLSLSRAWSFETRCNAHLAFPHTGVSTCEPYLFSFLQGFSLQRKDPVRNREKQEIVEGCTHAMREIDA